MMIKDIHGHGTKLFMAKVVELRNALQDQVAMMALTRVVTDNGEQLINATEVNGVIDETIGRLLATFDKSSFTVSTVMIAGEGDGEHPVDVELDDLEAKFYDAINT